MKNRERMKNAITSGNVAQICSLIEKGVHVNTVDLYRNTAFHAAAIHNSFDLAKILIGKGADINIPNRWGYTPIYRCRSIEMCRYMVENGADINHICSVGGTPLTMNCFNGEIELVRFMVEDLKVPIEGEKTGTLMMTPLISAADWGHQNIVEYLIKMGANVNEYDTEGLPPLWYALKINHTEMAKYLILTGADLLSYDVKTEKSTYYYSPTVLEEYRIADEKGDIEPDERESIDLIVKMAGDPVLPLRLLCINAVYAKRVPYSHIPEAFFDR